MRVRVLLTLFCLLWISIIPLYSQSPRVPSKMEFAGIKLRLMEDVRREIQEDVDALTKSPKYFNIKVERAKSYFPIIERVFKEEGLHDDFKYLVLQESSLISDAVSVSDAVGFWQFKDFTAMEVGLRVDKQIDERMHIVESSRGAARYMYKNNEFFDNWLHALQAYQMGAGGAMRVLGEGDKGANSMVITKKTYWYVKKYLAHKVAFENAVYGPGRISLTEYKNGANKSLKDISEETGVALDKLEDYNKWLRKGKIPDDKTYTVILPLEDDEYVDVPLVAKHTETRQPQVEERLDIEYDFPEVNNFPAIEDIKGAQKGQVVEINELPGVIASGNDKAVQLAKKGDIDLSKFLKYNDIQINDPIIDGQVYYLKNKRTKAPAHYYVAKPGETMWYISQKFGVRLKKLLAKNRMKSENELKPGRVLWLRYIRPSKVDIEYREVEKEKTPVREVESVSGNVEVNEGESPKELAEKKLAKAEPVETEDREPAVLASEYMDDIDSDEDNGADQYEYGRQSEDQEESSVDERYDEAVVKNYSEDIEEEEEQEEGFAEEEQMATVKKIHIVEPGETLYSISKLHGVSVVDMLDWNGLKISDKLSVNQKLFVMQSVKVGADGKLDEMENVAEAYTYHIVNQGDTIYKIARAYDVTIEDLMTWNDKKDFSISLGEKIKIKKKRSN